MFENNFVGNIDQVVGGGEFGDLASQFGGNGFIWTDADQFMKAVTSGYATDIAGMTGGQALQLQSIEESLLATTQEEQHFVMFNDLGASNATASIDEYVTQTTIGGFPGSTFNDETGEIAEYEGDFNREFLKIKYLMTMASVSVVQANTKTVVDTIANQTKNAILRLLTDCEWGILYGDSAIVPQEFDGLAKLITANASVDHVIDLRGASFSAAAAEFIQGQQLVTGLDNFGRLTDAYMSNLVASDLDQKLDPAFRVNISSAEQKVKVGAPVSQIVTRWGNITPKSDIFIREGELPFASRSSKLAALVAAAAMVAPASVGAVAAPTAGSKFLTAHAGAYYYGAEALSKRGRSAFVKMGSAVTIAAGDGVTVTITAGNGGTETGYWLFRSRRNGTNANSDFREMIRLAKGGATTVYVDLNQNIPGTSIAVGITRRPDAAVVRRLLPLTKFPLATTNRPIIPWAHLLFLALRVAKPMQHVIWKNILPAAQTWRPFSD